MRHLPTGGAAMTANRYVISAFTERTGIDQPDYDQVRGAATDIGWRVLASIGEGCWIADTGAPITDDTRRESRGIVFETGPDDRLKED